MAPQLYTLTGATDWPMFVGMVHFFAWVFSGVLGLIGVLVGALWVDMRKQFNAEKTARKEQCVNCSDANLREHNAMWDALDECCPRVVQKHRPKRRKTDELSGD